MSCLLLKDEDSLAVHKIKYYYLMGLQYASMPEDRENKMRLLSKFACTHCMFTAGHKDCSLIITVDLKGRFLHKDKI